jgi:hypothetical protein
MRWGAPPKCGIMHLGTRLISKDDGRDLPIREAVMAPRRHIKKLAVLVDTTPEALVEIMGDVFSETIHELQMYKPRACGRIARDIRRHRQMNGVGAGT